MINYPYAQYYDRIITFKPPKNDTVNGNYGASTNS